MPNAHPRAPFLRRHPRSTDNFHKGHRGLRSDAPETCCLGDIARTVPPHQTYSRISGVLATLTRIDALRHVRIDGGITARNDAGGH